MLGRYPTMVGVLLCCWLPTSALADITPPPPDCDTSGSSCTVYLDSSIEDGECMLGADGEMYCQVGTDCYPMELEAGGNQAEPCPADAVDADVDDDDGDGSCAIGWRDGGSAAGGLATVMRLAGLWLSRRRRAAGS